MKKILALLLVLLLLCGCTTQPQQPTEPTEPTTIDVIQVTDAPTEEATEATTEAPTEAPTQAPTEAPTQAPTEAPTTPSVTDPGTTESGLWVHFLDVQHADCILLECDGEFALVDGAFPENGDQIVSYIRGQGADHLELLVGTHPHGDHIGGLPTVLDAFPTDTVWTSQLPYSNDYVNNFRNAISRNGADFQQPRPGAQFRLGSATIDMIGPLGLEYEDANNLSLVLMVTYGNTRFLLTGDMEDVAEKQLVEAGVDLKADVLKVGHHGSSSSTTYRFLRAVAPTYGVISLAANNEYGHPHRDPLSRLMDADVTIYRTDNMYDIVAYSDGQNISFTCGNSYANPWRPGDPR